MTQPNLAVLSFSEQENALSHSVTDYIFNTDNLIDYEVGALQSLSLVHKAMRKAEQPFSGVAPSELAKAVNQVDLSTPCESLNEALAEVESLYLNHAVYFHHPHYVAHLNCPIAYPAVIAEQILTAVNTSVDTWDQSGGATLIEQKLIDWTCQHLGFGDNADGIFTSGGTQSNLMAMLVAREHAIARYAPGHEIKHHGMPQIARRFRIFTSKVSHFSIQKAAAMLGMGYDSVVSVDTDMHFRMDPHALQSAIAQACSQGLIPICINATAGTTDFGSIDPLEQIAQIAKDVGAWMHVDAAYGGGLLLSKLGKPRLRGVELADSATIDYHKSFMQPVSCSGFFMQNREHFGHITLYSDYLNPLAEAGNGTPNLVDKSLQTTRRFDGLKLWMTLRIMGEQALGQGMDKIMALAKQTHLLLCEHGDFQPLHVPELSALVFRFAPEGVDPQALNTINQQIRSHFLSSGEIMLARTKVNNQHYLKFTLLNPATNIDNLATIIARISELGWQFAKEQN